MGHNASINAIIYSASGRKLRNQTCYKSRYCAPAGIAGIGHIRIRNAVANDTSADCCQRGSICIIAGNLPFQKQVRNRTISHIPKQWRSIQCNGISIAVQDKVVIKYLQRRPLTGQRNICRQDKPAALRSAFQLPELFRGRNLRRRVTGTGREHAGRQQAQQHGKGQER